MASKRLFIHACAVVLLLRLCLPVLLGDGFTYISEIYCNYLTAILIFCLSFLFILHKFFHKEAVILSRVDVPIGLSLLAAVLSLAHSVNFSMSLNAVFVFLSGILLFYILHDSLEDEASFHIFWRYFFAGALVVSIVGIWEYFLAQHPLSIEVRRVLNNFDEGTNRGFHYKRIASLFDWPNVLAGFQMLVLPITWAGFMLAQKRWQKICLGGSILLFLVVFLFTFSMMGVLGFFLVSLLFLPQVLKISQQKNEGKFSFWVVGIGVLLFILIILTVRNNFDVSPRLDYLRQAFCLLKAHPFWGTGPDTFPIVSTPYVTQRLGFSAYVHNSYLQIWVENGFLGFIGVLALIGVFILTALKVLQRVKVHTDRIIFIALIWAMTAFFIDNLSNFTMLRPNMSLFWWAILAVFFAFERNRAGDYLENQHRAIVVGMRMGVGGLLVLSVLLFFLVRMSLSLLAYNQGVYYFNKYKSEAEVLFPGQKVKPGGLNKDVFKTIALDISLAEDFFNQSIQLNPFECNYPQARADVFLQKYFLTKDIQYLEMAQKNYEQALRISPYSYKIYINCRNIAILKKDPAFAKKLFDDAVLLCPMLKKS
ncbi:MAG: O-antigen ligase family protein [Candidatus Omnitrophica bacterium]|nr:O-antigen ligase family protein [Candidatus Omnitrophota bacterium]